MTFVYEFFVPGLALVMAVAAYAYFYFAGKKIDVAREARKREEHDALVLATQEAAERVQKEQVTGRYDVYQVTRGEGRGATWDVKHAGSAVDPRIVVYGGDHIVSVAPPFPKGAPLGRSYGTIQNPGRMKTFGFLKKTPVTSK